MGTMAHGVVPGVAHGKAGLYDTASVPSTLLNGLVSWWKLDEESGTRADAVGSNDLTDNNTVLFSAGKVGNAAAFVAGNSESLSSVTAPTIVSGNTFTSAGWVRPLAGTYVTAMRMGFHTIIAAGAVGPSIYVTGYSHDGTTTRTVSGYTGIAHGNWVHIIEEVTMPGTMKVWWNDTLLGESASLDSFLAPAYTQINVSSAGALGTGDADLVGVWNRALTADERTELYNAGAGVDYPF